MLQTFYNSFGFAGALTIAFLLFIFIVFWIAGLAGICKSGLESRDGSRVQNRKILFAILLPPYPFFWMIWEIYTQKKQLREAE